MTPVHSDKRRFSFFDPLLIVAAGYMIVQGFGTLDGVPILIGVSLVIFLVFTKHSRYDLFEDELVIRYWAPRRIIIHFSQIQAASIARVPFGGTSVVINRAGGRILAIMPKDPEAFLGHMNARLGLEYGSLQSPNSPPPPDSPDRSDSPEPADSLESTDSLAPEASSETLTAPRPSALLPRRRPRRRR